MARAREGRPAVGYSLTPPVTWAREGPPAAVGYSLTPPVTWARGGRAAVGHSLAIPVTWAGRGRSLLTCGDVEANPGPGGWRSVALLAWLSLWALFPLLSLSLAPLPATAYHMQGALGICAAPARTGANCPCIAGRGARGPFSASKAPHCPLCRAEHFSFSQFQLRVLLALTRTRVTRERQSRRWLQVWVLLPPLPPPPQPPGADWGRGGPGAVRRHSPPPWAGFVACGAGERHLLASPRG